MNSTSEKFGRLLSDAINRIHMTKRLSKGEVIRRLEENIGYSSSTIYSWRKGKIPEDESLELLATALFKEGGLNCHQLLKILKSTGYAFNPLYKKLCDEDKIELPIPRETFAPFYFGTGIQHPRQFFDREPILTKIFRMWRNSALQCGAIIGDRRSGKTALLEYVRQISVTPASELRPGQKRDWLPKGQSLQWVFIDFQDPGNLKQTSLLETILSRLNLPIPNPCTQINFNRLMGEQLQTRTVILMDEFDKALTSEKSDLDQDFWEGMRALVRRTKGKLGFLVAALTEPSKLAIHHGITSPFFNIFLCLNRRTGLGPFNQTVAREMMDSSPIPFAEEDKVWIMQQSQCWPHKLQVCCYYRLAGLEEGRQDNAWKDNALAEMERF